MIIGVTINNTSSSESENVIETGDDINHEEFHATKSLDGEEHTNESDHKEYFGEERSDSPDSAKIDTEKKYQNTKAHKTREELRTWVKENL